MEKINVCLLNDSFPPAIDGVANTTVNYAKIINKDLGKASVVTPNYPGVIDNYDLKPPDSYIFIGILLFIDWTSCKKQLI